VSKGVQLLERFCQEDRIRIRQPRCNLQIKFVRPLSSGNHFIDYVDAIGKLDDQRCLLEWKATSIRYSEEPDGLLAVDPQLVCYSWLTGIHEVRRWYSFASAWSKSNTCAPPSPMTSAGSSAT